MTACTPPDSVWNRATDPEIFSACTEQDRVLVTADKRLMKYLAASNATTPSVIVVRGFGGRISELGDALESSLTLVADTIGTRGHAVFSIGPGRPIRVQLLPLGDIGIAPDNFGD